MISFLQPEAVVWNGKEIPLSFPYIAVYLQGKPKHYMDEFSHKHPTMERGKRAKIFAPFDALDGYGDAVRSKNVLYTDKIELDDEQKEELNRKLTMLRDLTFNRRLAKANHVIVTVMYYVPCQDENNFAFGSRGEYILVTGMVWKVDTEIGHSIEINQKIIPLGDILDISFTCKNTLNPDRQVGYF